MMTKDKTKNVYYLFAMFFILVFFLIFLMSCNMAFKTYYSCPLETSKKGNLYQKLYQPPKKIKLKKINV